MIPFRLIAFVSALLLATLPQACQAASPEPRLVTEAATMALEAARQSLEASPKLDGVTRVGIVDLENDPATVTDLLKSMVTRTQFDVIIIDDAEWTPLLDEFARQVQREDIVLPETAHQLRVQGVDAVMYCTSVSVSQESIEADGQAGAEVTLDIHLNLASLDESNPGSLVWSERFTGAARDLKPMSIWECARSLFEKNKVIVTAVGALLVLMALVVLYRRAIQPR